MREFCLWRCLHIKLPYFFQFLLKMYITFWKVYFHQWHGSNPAEVVFTHIQYFIPMLKIFEIRLRCSTNQLSSTAKCCRIFSKYFFKIRFTELTSYFTMSSKMVAPKKDESSEIYHQVIHLFSKRETPQMVEISK